MQQWNRMATERDAIVGEGMAEYNALYRELDLPALIMTEN
jgi:hypothetical protein